jgi:hypothetical protein
VCGRVPASLFGAMLITACSCSRPTTQSVAKKISGCRPRSPSTGLSTFAPAEVTCHTSVRSVWLATFSPSAIELDFVNSSGGVPRNDCVQGSGGGASIIENSDNGKAQAQESCELGGPERVDNRM